MNQELIKEITDLDYGAVAERLSAFLEERVRDAGAGGLVLGLSGGIDSAVLAYLCRGEMADRSLAVIMPDTDVTPEQETADAQRIVSITGIGYKLVDICPVVREYAMRLEPDPRARGNLRARVRGDILYYYANQKNRLVLGSSDKSEHMIGYFTKFGDGAADIAPISGLYKTQVRGLARHLGVPGDIVAKKSSPHLWEGHAAEKELGISYEEIDAALFCMYERGMTAQEAQEAAQLGPGIAERVRAMHENSRHKREPPGGCGI